MSSRLASRLTSNAPSCQPGARPPKAEVYPLAKRPANSRTKPVVDCVPHLVAARATAMPEAPALFAGAEKMTYGELDQRANQIAHYLMSLDEWSNHPNQQDRIIAICLDRSLAGVSCALGILKAGAAYLPLDPVYPIERLAYMLSDAQPRVLITSKVLAEQLPAGPWRVIAIDDMDGGSNEIGRQSTDAPHNEISSEQLAYVIYTSGSTGRPKGVAITHASLLNLVLWHQRAFAVTPEDRASLLAGVGFDAAVWETWPHLVAGARLHLPDEATRLAPELLRDWLVTEQITISFLPTALAERVMNLEWPSDTALRTLLTGAETLRQFPSDNLPFRLVNNYGPTESTVVATSGAVTTDIRTNGLPTIGRPITNTQLYILDGNMQEVPVQSAGEIYLGGAGVARGYLKRPDLTAERFVPDPFSTAPGARLYRTGDLARYLLGGELVYLGRIDQQIKIMGHRIEPNEIVAVLERHPSIQASRVVAREVTCSEKHLVAYVVLNSEIPTSAAGLRSFLAKELPQYMVPSVFVRLEMLPFTQNGKVDHAALPAPNTANTLRDEMFTAPRTTVEERLSVMLSALLGLEQVSVNDNFFMLGGHSLLGTQLISQIRGAFGVELALRTLFESPTIEQLALAIEELVIARVGALSEEEVQQLLT